ncbi:unnamed protein product [Heligmosomoides polygyrus]|uniref:BPTI/Kunitz inhibitor domain-containing protein n=1 Tax=Heligmosomoides polygyrus TaxID=6339 RepID=A0A3P8ABQ5_HELPZ|nr:unnamed protein product [Heligmosomoides polygyrus]
MVVLVAPYLCVHLRDFHLQSETFRTSGEILPKCSVDVTSCVHFSIHISRVPEYRVDSYCKNDVKNSERQLCHKTEVACSRSTYRFLCESGMPSQFVYRWEWENGKCQSFPYGYCLSEWNHPHPRTEAECQRYCGV